MGCANPPPLECEGETLAVGVTRLDTTRGAWDSVDSPCAQPGGADKVFEVDIPHAGTWLFDTFGPDTDFDTVLFVFVGPCEEAAEGALGCNDDVAWPVDDDLHQGGSALALHLEEGRVFVAVDGQSGDAARLFDITVQEIVCGDGERTRPEECDDGNEVAGDGCSEVCVWECSDDPNEEVEQASELLAIPVEGPTASFPEQVHCQDTGPDTFVVDLEPSEAVRVTLEPGGTLTTSCDQLDLELTLRGEEDAVALELTEMPDDEACRVVAFDAPAGGRLLFAVEQAEPMTPIDYRLEFEIAIPNCGDEVVQGLEQCDDGNEVSDDGCSPACTLDDATCDVRDVWSGETAVGMGASGSTDGESDDHDSGCVPVTSEDVVYAVSLNNDEVVVASLRNAGTDFDTVLSVRTLCRDVASEIARNNDGDTPASEVVFQAEADTTYYVIVDGYQGATGNYELTLDATDCGDGEPEPGEDCDDGNLIPGDGCEPDCTWTPYCDLDPDRDLGPVGAEPASFLVELAGAEDTLPDLPCSGAGGADSLLRFSLDEPGLLELKVEYPGGDVQVAVHRDDLTCSPLAACLDFGEFEVGGTQELDAEAGDHVIVLDSWGGNTYIPDVPVELQLSLTP